MSCLHMPWKACTPKPPPSLPSCHLCSYAATEPGVVSRLLEAGAFEKFVESISRVAELHGDIPAASLVEMHTALMRFTHSVHPERLDNVNRVLGACTRGLAGRCAPAGHVHIVPALEAVTPPPTHTHTDHHQQQQRDLSPDIALATSLHRCAQGTQRGRKGRACVSDTAQHAALQPRRRDGAVFGPVSAPHGAAVPAHSQRHGTQGGGRCAGAGASCT